MSNTPRAWIVGALFCAGCSSNSPESAADGAGGTGPNVDNGGVGAAGTTGMNNPDVSQGGGLNNPDLEPGNAGTGSTGGIANAGGAGSDGTNMPLATGCSEDVPATSQVPILKNREYDAVIRDLVGVTALPSTGGPPSESLIADLEGALTSTAWNSYLIAASEIAQAVMTGDNRALYIACDPATDGCLQNTIETFGRKAFRRPLSEEEVLDFMTFDDLEPKGTPEEVAEAILAAFLVSPSFLLLPELSQDSMENGCIKLNSYEMATRLAILLWGSIPDDELNAAANRDELQTAEQIRAQAERMLSVAEKTGPLMTAFHRNYADIRFGAHWGTLDHDSSLYPEFAGKDAVNPAMMAEIDAFFAEVASAGTFRDLFLSNVAYVNEATAPLYGLNAGDFGAELSRVELDANERPGFLTRIGFLSSYSHYDSTAPILRGAYITKNIIGVDPGPPDPRFAEETVAGTFESNREYTEVLTSPETCANCHAAVVNPPGFVLEGFDAAGGIQIQDPMGGDINTTADVNFGVAIKTINNAKELMDEIALGAPARELYAEKWVRFATKREPAGSDQAMIETLTEKLADPGYTIPAVLSDITQADSFRVRKQGN